MIHKSSGTKTPRLNDKNSLCWRGSIDEMALYGKGKISTTYAVVGLDYGDTGLVMGVKGREGYLYSDGIH